MLHSWYVLKTWQKYFAVCTTTWLTCDHGFMIIHSSSSEGIVQQGVYAVCTHSIWDPVWPRYTFKTCFIARPSLWHILPGHHCGKYCQAITVAHIASHHCGKYCQPSLWHIYWSRDTIILCHLLHRWSTQHRPKAVLYPIVWSYFGVEHM